LNFYISFLFLFILSSNSFFLAVSSLFSPSSFSSFFSSLLTVSVLISLFKSLRAKVSATNSELSSLYLFKYQETELDFSAAILANIPYRISLVPNSFNKESLSKLAPLAVNISFTSCTN